MLYHLALATDWDAARAAGEYRISTLGVTLEQEGFIHTSRSDQLHATAERFYRGVEAQLVLLQIDESLLSSPWRVDPIPGAADGFPHVYGPINVSAVTRAEPVTALPGGGWAGLPAGV
ncbi:MAG TPA: DUF952 domain-containing protein [Kineosporiaceae bacterium]|nr:DUF952 domain-containing protein [Kineosporiaceae bacterium]